MKLFGSWLALRFLSAILPLLSSTICYTVDYDGARFVGLGPGIDVVSDLYQFIPLGHRAKVICDALESTRERAMINESSVRWSVLRPPPEPERRNFTREFFSGHFVRAANSSLYVLDLQEVHNQTVLECLVDTTDRERHSFLSRVTLVIQDCGEDDELKSISMLNPCMFGGCKVDKSSHLHRLECICLEQYTGEFCEVPKEGILLHELLFYSPVIANFVVLSVLFLFFYCLEKRRSFHPSALGEVLADHWPLRRELTLQELYPSAFVVLPDEFEDELKVALREGEEEKKKETGKSKRKRRSI